MKGTIFDMSKNTDRFVLDLYLNVPYNRLALSGDAIRIQTKTFYLAIIKGKKAPLYS